MCTWIHMYNTMYLVATIKYNYYNFHNYNIIPTELGRPDLYRPREIYSHALCILLKLLSCHTAQRYSSKYIC